MGSGATKNKEEVVRTKVRIMGNLGKHTEEPQRRRSGLLEFIRRQKEANSDVAPEHLESKGFRRPSLISETSVPVEPSIMRLKEKLAMSSEELNETSPYCFLCDRYAGFGGYSCRVCPRTYHYECLKKCGEVRESVLDLVERSRASVGWSCHICDNVSKLLTDAEMKEILEDFERVDINQDSGVNWDEYIRYRASGSEANLTADEINTERVRFHVMDADGNGVVDWWEFLNSESVRVLSRRPKADLVDMLEGKEIDSCQRMFACYDEDGDGCITATEARRAFMKWERRASENVDARVRMADKRSKFLIENGGDAILGEKRASETFDMRFRMAENRAKLLIEDGGDLVLGTVTLEEFVKAQAIYCISARPNCGEHALNINYRV